MRQTHIHMSITNTYMHIHTYRYVYIYYGMLPELKQIPISYKANRCIRGPHSQNISMGNPFLRKRGLLLSQGEYNKLTESTAADSRPPDITQCTYPRTLQKHEAKGTHNGAIYGNGFAHHMPSLAPATRPLLWVGSCWAPKGAAPPGDVLLTVAVCSAR